MNIEVETTIRATKTDGTQVIITRVHQTHVGDNPAWERRSVAAAVTDAADVLVAQHGLDGTSPL